MHNAGANPERPADLEDGDLVYEMAGTGSQPPEIEEGRQAAWVAISALAKTLKEEGFAAPALWKAAFGATETWIEPLD